MATNAIPLLYETGYFFNKTVQQSFNTPATITTSRDPHTVDNRPQLNLDMLAVSGGVVAGRVKNPDRG